MKTNTLEDLIAETMKLNVYNDFLKIRDELVEIIGLERQRNIINS